MESNQKTLRELLRRDLGIKPTDVFNGYDGYKSGRCGKCSMVVYHYNTFCPKCGFRIKWGLYE